MVNETWDFKDDLSLQLHTPQCTLCPHCTTLSCYNHKMKAITMVYTEFTASSLILTQNQRIKTHILVLLKSPTFWHSIAHCPVPASLTSALESKPRENTSSVEQDKSMC